MHRVQAIVRTDTSGRSQLIDNTKFVPGQLLTNPNNYMQQLERLFMVMQLFTNVSIIIFYIIWSHAQIRFLFDFFRQCLRKKRKNCAGARCYRPLSRILPHYAFFFFFHLFFSRLLYCRGWKNEQCGYVCMQMTKG